MIKSRELGRLLRAAAAPAGVLATATALAQPAPDPAPKQAAAKLAVGLCSTCHGSEGRGDDPRVPRLAAQHSEYLFIQMQSMRTRLRNNPAMHGVAKELTDGDVAALAAYLQSK